MYNIIRLKNLNGETRPTLNNLTIEWNTPTDHLQHGMAGAPEQ